MLILLLIIDFILQFSWIDPAFLDLSNNKAYVNLLTGTPTADVTETESNLYPSPVDNDDNDDEFEDEPDALEDKTWLEKGMEDVDPWKNVKLESLFEYPMEDDASLFHQIDS